MGDPVPHRRRVPARVALLAGGDSLLAIASRRPGQTVEVPVLLVRHADAGSRLDWPGDDRSRPLSERGLAQAASLALGLAPLGPCRVLSSPFLRCTQTARPLAERLGLEVEATEELSEGHTPLALRLLRVLAGQAAVVVTHGDVVAQLLRALAEQDGLDLPAGPSWAKASTWALEARSGRFLSASYRPPPRLG